MGWPQGWPVAARTWGRTNQAWSSLGKRFMASRWPGPVRLSPKGFWQAAISKADPQVLRIPMRNLSLDYHVPSLDCML